jgi:hypothetical protein
MAYSDFTVPQLKQAFGLTIEEETDLFALVPDAPPPPPLTETLRRYLPLALRLNTEKARSELLIAPVLVEFKLVHRDRLALFSGIEFNVDEAAGLKGRCDFILSRDPEQLYLCAPICVLVEAKNENIIAGIPQCIAEMVAAQRFNKRSGMPEEAVFGVVTTGMLWRFLKLDGTLVNVDVVEYPIQGLPKLVGILTQITLS